MQIIREIVDAVFEIGLFINAALFIPQAIHIISKKSAKGVSLTTFLGFWIIQLFIILHAYFYKDYLLFYGYLFSLLTCGVVIVLILLYRSKQ